MDLTYLLDLANQSGGILYLLAALMTLALTVIVERSWALRRLVRGRESRPVRDQGRAPLAVHAGAARRVCRFGRGSDSGPFPVA